MPTQHRRRGRRAARPTEELSGLQRLNRAFFLVLLAGAIVLMFFVARAYLLPLALAAIAAALFHPLYTRTLKAVRSRATLAALLSMALFCLLIVIPVAILGYLITQNVIDLVRLINQNLPRIKGWLEQLEAVIGRLPFLEGRRVSELIDSERLLGVIQRAGSSLVGQDTRLHPLLVFVGVLGGVSVFGIWGLLFGPLAMSVLVTLLAIFKRIFQRELRGI